MYNRSVNKFYKVLVMQVVENTCIGHEISLRKISEPLASKALDFILVTARPQETQCWRSATSAKPRCGAWTASGVRESPPSGHPTREQDSRPPACPCNTVECGHTTSFQSSPHLLEPK